MTPTKHNIVPDITPGVCTVQRPSLGTGKLIVVLFCEGKVISW